MAVNRINQINQVTVIAPRFPQSFQGPPGATGPGVPDGGTTNQLLRKVSGADQDTGWASPGDLGLPTLAADNTFTGINAGANARSLAELKARSTAGLTGGETVTLNAGGRSGAFRFLAGDQTAKVSDPAKSVTAINAGAGTLTITAHGYGPGNRVVANQTSNGLTAGTVYFVQWVDDNTLRLHTNWLDCLHGLNEVTLTGSPSGLTLSRLRDPQQGHIITPNSDTTGASGVWERVDNDDMLDPRHFGAVACSTLAAARASDSTMAIQGAMDYAAYDSRAGVLLPPKYFGYSQLVVRPSKALRGYSPGGFGLTDALDNSELVQITSAFGHDGIVFESYSDGSSIRRCGEIDLRDFINIGPASGAETVGNGVTFRRPLIKGESRTDDAVHLIVIVAMDCGRVFNRGWPEHGLFMRRGIAAPGRIYNTDCLFNGGYGIRLEMINACYGLSVSDIYCDGNKGGAAVYVAVPAGGSSINLSNIGGEKRTANPYGNTGSEDGAQPYAIEIGDSARSSVINITGGVATSTPPTHPLAHTFVNVTNYANYPRINLQGVRLLLASGKTDSPTHRPYLLYDQLLGNHVELAETNAINWPNSLRNGSGLKNLWLNGGHVVAQRGTSFPTANSFAFTLDRWFAGRVGGGGNVSISRQDFTAPSGLPGEPAHFLRCDVSGLASAAGFSLGWVSAPVVSEFEALLGQVLTVSFWAKADIAFAPIVRLSVNYGSGGSTTENVNALEGTTVTLSTGWRLYTRTFLMPSLSGKTVGTKPTVSVLWRYDSASPLAVMDLANCQVEFGWPTAFETLAQRGGVEAELARCRKYFRRSAYFVPAGTAQSLGQIDMASVPAITGGGAGFDSTGTTKDTLIAFQTSGAVQTLDLSAE
jgi:hypothetical protein